MKHKYNKLMIAGLVLGIVNLIASLFCIFTLPDVVPTHFDINWVCDSMGSPYTALFTAVLPLGFMMFFWFLEKIGAIQEEKNRSVLWLTFFLLTAFEVITNWFVLLSMRSGVQIGEKIENPYMMWVLLFAFGILTVVLGNYMPIVARNRMLGLRVKWTLESETCWRLTHRFMGRLLVVSGLVFIAVLFVLMLCGVPEMTAFIVFMVFVMFIIVVPSMYAYLHKSDEADKKGDNL